MKNELLLQREIIMRDKQVAALLNELSDYRLAEVEEAIREAESQDKKPEPFSKPGSSQQVSTTENE